MPDFVVEKFTCAFLFQITLCNVEHVWRDTGFRRFCVVMFGIWAENMGRKWEFHELQVGEGFSVFNGLGCEICKGNRPVYRISILTWLDVLCLEYNHWTLSFSGISNESDKSSVEASIGILPLSLSWVVGILELHCDLLCNGLWHQWHMPVSNVFHAA